MSNTWKNSNNIVDNDTTELIYKSIIMDTMKSKVLQIQPPVRDKYGEYQQLSKLQIYKPEWKMKNGWTGNRCVFLKKNGEMCTNSFKFIVDMDKDYTSYLFTGFACCAIHKNQYNKLSDSGKRDTTIQITGNVGYRIKHGIMCKV